MVGITEQEKSLSYAKYYFQELAPIPEDKLKIGSMDVCVGATGLPIERKDEFLKGTDKGIQCGFCVMDDGIGYVANSTFMPSVTVEMCDWWFGWHSVGSDLRYKIWDHDDHYHARADKPEYVRDPKIPYHQKTWGVQHFIKEDIGAGAEEIFLNFKNPKDFGYDISLIGTEKCQSLVCAIGEGSTRAFMTHKFYEVQGGTMFESRFWMGVGYIEGRLVKILPEEIKVPTIATKMLFLHNIKEFTNLAAILPSLFSEEKENWQDDSGSSK